MGVGQWVRRWRGRLLLLLLPSVSLTLALLSACCSAQVREMLLLRQLSQTMRQASAAGGFFDAWMKNNSDLVQGAANAFAGRLMVYCLAQTRDGLDAAPHHCVVCVELQHLMAASACCCLARPFNPRL